jgi:hypothetical protein
MGLGNIISQTTMEKKTLDTLDWPRVARFAAFGYFFTVIRGEIVYLNIEFFVGTYSSLLVLWIR